MIFRLKNDTTFDVEKLHDVQLSILHKLDDVCKRNGLNYYLAFGTLIGAVRHDGFIPWDDDIDVVMSYPDYQKLQLLPQSEWGGDFFLQDRENDPEFSEPFMKLRKNSTTLITEESSSRNMNQGVFINIYPLISVPDDERDRKRQKKWANLNLELTENKPTENRGAISSALCKLGLKLMPASLKQALIRKSMRKITAYENSGSEEVFAFAKSPSLGISMKKDFFRESVSHAFEGRQLQIPSGYHDWLTLRYGDYMALPPEQQRTPQIANYVLVDTEKPFIDYKGEYYGTDTMNTNDSPSSAASKNRFTASLMGFIEYIVLLVAILAVWQVSSMTGNLNPLTLPSLDSIVTKFIKLIADGSLLANIGISISRVLKGYILAALLAIVLGVFIGLSKHFRKLTALIIQILKPIPPIAWIPLVILWFGIDEESKVFLIFIGSFFTILTNVVDGIRQTDVKLIELSRVMETPKLKYIFKVVIPSASASIFTGLRVGLGQSWMCVVAAELVASSTGVGYMIMNARQFGQTDVVIVGMLTIGIIGKIMDSVLSVVERKAIGWM